MSYEKNERNKTSEYQIYVSVTGYESKTIGKEEVIFYKIELYSEITEKDWILVYRFNELNELFLILSQYFFKVPSFPSKSFGKVSNINELNKRKELLDKFFNELIKRPDLLTNIYTYKFLKLENHYPDFELFQPLPIYNLEELSYPISAFYFDKSLSLLFVGLSNTSISGKINNYFSKIFSSNKNSAENSQNNIPGFLLIYNIIKNNSGSLHFELIYQKSFTSEVSSINFYNSKNMLCVGLNNGTVAIYRLFVNESSKITKELIEEMCTVKAHKKKIVGVCINFTLGYVYSTAREGCLNISEINYQSLMKSYPVSKKEISCLVYDETWGRIFLSDEIGSIWIIDIMTNALQPRVLQALHNQIPSITTLNVDLNRNILCIGNKFGIAVVYEIENYNEKIIPQYENMSNINIKRSFEIKLDTNLKITDIIVNYKKEIIISLSNGSIAIYSHREDYPEYVLDSHNKEIVGFYWDEEKKMLMTLSQDKTIKIFQLPIHWPSEMVRKAKHINSKTLINYNKIPEESKNNSSVIDNLNDDADNYNIEGKIENLPELTEKEIHSEDLDGWEYY